MLLGIRQQSVPEKNQSTQFIMDSAYDAKSISQFVRGRSRIPIIDQNPRRKPSREAFDAATKEHYKKRSVVERANSHLKDWLLPEKGTGAWYQEGEF